MLTSFLSVPVVEEVWLGEFGGLSPSCLGELSPARAMWCRDNFVFLSRKK